MRIHLRLSPNTTPVPFDHLANLTGTLHKWLGDNDLHDGMSLYSFGWLRNARVQRGALQFPHGARWWVAFHNPDAAKALLRGLMADSEVAFGMHVQEAQLIDGPDFGTQQRFRTDGAVIARTRRDDGSRRYLLWDEPESDEALTRTLRSKLETAGFSDEHLEAQLRFDRDYSRAKTKLATIKGIKHKGSLCPVIVEGTPEAVAFAFDVGVGELTGSGFGGLQAPMSND